MSVSSPAVFRGWRGSGLGESLNQEHGFPNYRTSSCAPVVAVRLCVMAWVWGTSRCKVGPPLNPRVPCHTGIFYVRSQWGTGIREYSTCAANWGKSPCVLDPNRTPNLN
eukprot:1179458-Prorocentrum_minimum.AAC.1